jgi:hypothetical protein
VGTALCRLIERLGGRKEKKSKLPKVHDGLKSPEKKQDVAGRREEKYVGGGQGRALAGVRRGREQGRRPVRRSEEVRPGGPEPDKTNRTNGSREADPPPGARVMCTISCR